MGRLIGIKSDVGNKRVLNEDFVKYFEDEDIAIFAIADGMGGHNAGEVASKMALETVIDYLKKNKEEESRIALTKAVNLANHHIYKAALLKDEYSGMGTTITICYIKDEKCLVANVGDSRCYVICKDRLIKVTKDHSLVQELLDNGTISEEEAQNHPNKNVITRAIGTKPIVEVDLYELNLNEFDKGLLCTDGLTNELSEQEICNIIITDKEDVCDELIKASKDRGGRDNISVIIFKGACGDDWNHIGE
ncbi:Stp1/IreP family PP2C-type Ser/Thr phosphatase [Clostridium senegalense]|uniref:Stp1/IreP family PP2C-type Ser/Thr phosphatase n=1 Tax=Clostridium senegalense TaxID=1465809 RepID=UPI001C11747E|nr:Stp1/IreP family PP2C-type Ser/Thr phosphatase [Clostridium senegalense]MBU5225593.1 Stp1/IreP family PP2C-type Ser/Thr phosphatase [Clostridium senegalense]